MRLLLLLVVLALPTAALAAQPQVPEHKSGAKRHCRPVTVNGYRFQIYVIRGVPCGKARKVARQGIDVKGWTYYDWTAKRGPWSDVWVRDGSRKTIAAIAPKA